MKIRGGIMYPEPVSERDWAAQSDARTLAEAEAIKKDEGRMKAAQGWAKKIADAEMEKAKTLKRIANAKPSYKVKPPKV